MISITGHLLCLHAIGIRRDHGLGGGLLLGSVGILALGIYFKRESYKMAMKAGIDISHSGLKISCNNFPFVSHMG